jgi:dCTP deaminase
VSYGLSSYGYDIRVADEFKVFTNINSTVSIRRTSTPARSWTSRPTSASSRRTRSRWRKTVEYFRIPRDVLTVCVGKSTYARCGSHRQRHAVRARVGRLRDARDLEHDAAPRQGYANEGISQVLFFQSDEECEVSYADKKASIKGSRA